MYFRLFALIAALLAGAAAARGANPPAPLSELKLSQLEQRLAEIDAELEQLAKMSLRSGVGSIGYRSRGYDSPNTPISIDVELEHEVAIDEVVLVPTLWRDSEKGFQSDGFPVSFRVIAKSTQHPDGTVLADFGPDSGILPRLAPLVIPVDSIPASQIRIEVSQLSKTAFNQKYSLQLAEVLIFSGHTNVALKRPATFSLEAPQLTRLKMPWDPHFMLDGHVPYLMDAATGEKSIAYISVFSAPPTFTVDLLESQAITGIHLHAVDQSDTVPQSYAGDLGIPRRLKVEGANQADFSDAVTILQTNSESLYETGPIMMWNIPETFCRYVRLTEVDPDEYFRIGFAEIELFSGEQNVARGKPTIIEERLNPNRSLDALTDGRNLYGEILPIRTWMQQLARRHDLESERPFVTQELSRRYAQQKANMRRISWLAVTLLFIIVIVIMLEQIARQRAISRTRERIAANLHDELGANLHAIGLLGDFAKKIVARKNAQDEWAELAEVIDEVRTLTEETGETARYCTNMLETKEIHANLIAEMKRTADRLLTDLSYDLDFPEDENSLQELKPRRRIDLYLFYKECLTNILRHSSASHVSTQLTATSKNITLIISDNGQGLVDNDTPKSLRRRARLLGGRVCAENLTTGGLQITLQLHPRRRRRLHRN